MLSNYILFYILLNVFFNFTNKSSLPGMIPLRYGGVWHCFKLILNEEGIKGIYRGFFAYILAVNLLFFNIKLILNIF